MIAKNNIFNILLGIAMAAMETSTRLHYHEIYNVMQKFNIKIV